MQKFAITVAAISSIIIGGCKSSEEDHEGPEADVLSEVEVSFDSLPPAVKDAFNKEHAGATVTKAEKETYKNGTVHYELEFKDATGKKHDAEFSADGEKLDEED